MTSKLVLDNIAGRTTAGSIAVVGEGNGTTTNLQQGLAKAWFESETLTNNSTTTDEDSFNISGFTDTAAGQLTPAYTSNFSNTGYSSVSVNGTRSTTISLTKYNASTSGETILTYDENDNAYTDVGMCGNYLGDLA